MKIIIVGAGFAGLRLARGLNNKKGIDVILIDRHNYHQFQPLFYQVATAGLDASNISFPLRKVFHKSKNVLIRLAELLEILPAENKIRTDIGEFSYDILVLATGAETNFFGNPRLQDLTLPMKSTPEALQIRYSLIQNLENAVRLENGPERIKNLTIVVIGGGPTGVELSGAFAEMKHYVLPKDYPEIDFSQMKIYLLEGSPRTLAAMSEKSSADSKRYLEKLGVQVMVNTVVKDYDGAKVILRNGEEIASNFVIWAAGVKGNVPKGIRPELIVKGNRIKTDRKGKMDGSENIYVIGDLAYMETPKYPHGHPQLAGTAVQFGKYLAKHLEFLAGHRKHDEEFQFRDKGTMATVGRNLAVVDIPRPRLHFRGLLAWMIWMSLHLLLLLGVKNRLFVFLNWLYNYVTYDQSLRLLFRGFKPKETNIK
jgi:NADH:ubiquinone reductase (H+-translocating)